MKITILLVLALFTLTARSQALTEKGKEAARQLQAALLEEAKAEKPKEGDERSGRGNMKQGMLLRLQELFANPDSAQFQESINQVIAYFTSDAVLKSAAELREEIRRERENADKAALANITDVLSRAGKAVREAKVPADLDGTIAELGKYRQRSERGQLSEEVRTAFYQVDPTLQFVTQWQNYLAAKASNNSQSANEALRNLSSSNGPSIVPRSEILALLKQPAINADEPDQPSPQEALEKILAGTKSLGDIEGSLKELRKLQEIYRRSNRGSDSFNSVIQSLQPLDKTYQDFIAGMAVNIDISSSYNSGLEVGSALFARLKSELFLLLLPRYVGAPEGTRALSGEDVAHFLDRLASEAKNRGDIGVAIRSREALRLLQRGSSFSSNDTVGLSAFVSGQNQETAGQWLPAVLSYQAALKSGSDLVPAKVIGERLIAIQMVHPKEFDAAMERFLNPPAPVYEGMGRRPTDNVPFRRNDQQPSQPALLIPPAPVSSPTPAAEAKP